MSKVPKPTLTELKLLLDWAKNDEVDNRLNRTYAGEQLEARTLTHKVQVIYDRECKKLIDELTI